MAGPRYSQRGAEVDTPDAGVLLGREFSAPVVADVGTRARRETGVLLGREFSAPVVADVGARARRETGVLLGREFSAPVVVDVGARARRESSAPGRLVPWRGQRSK